MSGLYITVAEITDVIKHRDGGIPNKNVNYVAGICGSRKGKNEYDLGDDVFSLVCFNGQVEKNNRWGYGRGEVNFPDINQITDYVVR